MAFKKVEHLTHLLLTLPKANAHELQKRLHEVHLTTPTIPKENHFSKANTHGVEMWGYGKFLCMKRMKDVLNEFYVKKIS